VKTPDEAGKESSAFSGKRLCLQVRLSMFTFDLFTRWSEVDKKAGVFFYAVQVIDHLKLLG